MQGIIAVITVFQLCVLSNAQYSTCQLPSSTPQAPDYYWRDYYGPIPPDAFAGGTDRDGNPTYVGQAYIRNFELLPVIIYPGCKCGNATAYDKELQTYTHIKILCARDLSKFAWVTTKDKEVNQITNCHLVIGGSEVGQTLNIGRVRYDGQIVIGKVFRPPIDNSGLWIPYRNKPLRVTSYEILTYNCYNVLNVNYYFGNYAGKPAN